MSTFEEYEPLIHKRGRDEVSWSGLRKPQYQPHTSNHFVKTKMISVRNEVIKWFSEMSLKDRMRTCCIEKEEWLVNLLLKFYWEGEKKEKNRFMLKQNKSIEFVKGMAQLDNINNIFLNFKDSSRYKDSPFSDSTRGRKQVLPSTRICTIFGFADSLALDSQILKDPKEFIDILDSYSGGSTFIIDIESQKEAEAHLEKQKESYFPGWFKINSTFCLEKLLCACFERNIFKKWRYKKDKLDIDIFSYPWEKVDESLQSWQKDGSKAKEKFEEFFLDTAIQLKEWIQEYDDEKDDDGSRVGKNGSSGDQRTKEVKEIRAKIFAKMIQEFSIKNDFFEIRGEEIIDRRSLIDNHLNKKPEIIIQDIFNPKLTDVSHLEIFLRFLSGEKWKELLCEWKRQEVLLEFENETVAKKKKKKRKKKKKSKNDSKLKNGLNSGPVVPIEGEDNQQQQKQQQQDPVTTTTTTTTTKRAKEPKKETSDNNLFTRSKKEMKECSPKVHSDPKTKIQKMLEEADTTYERSDTLNKTETSNTDNNALSQCTMEGSLPQLQPTSAAQDVVIIEKNQSTPPKIEVVASQNNKERSILNSKMKGLTKKERKKMRKKEEKREKKRREKQRQKQNEVKKIEEISAKSVAGDSINLGRDSKKYGTRYKHISHFNQNLCIKKKLSFFDEEIELLSKRGVGSVKGQLEVQEIEDFLIFDEISEKSKDKEITLRSQSTGQKEECHILTKTQVIKELKDHHRERIRQEVQLEKKLRLQKEKQKDKDSNFSKSSRNQSLRSETNTSSVYRKGDGGSTRSKNLRKGDKGWEYPSLKKQQSEVVGKNTYQQQQQQYQQYEDSQISSSNQPKKKKKTRFKLKKIQKGEPIPKKNGPNYSQKTTPTKEKKSPKFNALKARSRAVESSRTIYEPKIYKSIPFTPASEVISISQSDYQLSRQEGSGKKPKNRLKGNKSGSKSYKNVENEQIGSKTSKITQKSQTSGINLHGNIQTTKKSTETSTTGTPTPIKPFGGLFPFLENVPQLNPLLSNQTSSKQSSSSPFFENQVTKARPVLPETLRKKVVPLNSLVDGFVHKLKCLSQKTESSRKLTKQRLQKVMDLTFPNTNQPELTEYGSWKTGLLIPDSDIDFQITNTGAISREDVIQILDTFSFNLKNFGWVKDVKQIFSAKLPILKIEVCPSQYVQNSSTKNRTFQDPSRSLMVDITVETPGLVGQITTDYVCNLIDQHDQLFGLVLILKYYLNSKNLSDPYKGGLSSYAISLLVCAWIERFSGQTPKGLYPQLRALIRFYGTEFNPNRTAIAFGYTTQDQPENKEQPFYDMTMMMSTFYCILCMQNPNLLIVDPTSPLPKNVTPSAFSFHFVQAELKFLDQELELLEKSLPDLSVDLTLFQNRISQIFGLVEKQSFDFFDNFMPQIKQDMI